MLRVSRRYFAYKSPLGSVFISSDNIGITDVVFSAEVPEYFSSYIHRSSALTNQASNELLAYFAGKRKYFEVPLSFAGTEFQRRVWEETCLIPYGTTVTCSDIAKRIGAGSSHRSVGVALRRSTHRVFVPTHRVVLSSGQPLGVGLEASLRAQLLAFERSQC